VTNRQIRENKVAGWVRTVQVNHASNRCTGKNSGLIRVGHATRLSQMPGRLQCGEEEVVRVHHEGDIFGNFLAIGTGLEFQHLELDNWWWVDRPAIGGCLRMSVVSTCSSRWSKTYTSSQSHMRERVRVAGAP
jgi:hypothetical protein